LWRKNVCLNIWLHWHEQWQLVEHPKKKNEKLVWIVLVHPLSKGPYHTPKPCRIGCKAKSYISTCFHIITFLPSYNNRIIIHHITSHALSKTTQLSNQQTIQYNTSVVVCLFVSWQILVKLSSTTQMLFMSLVHVT
jgi:hypothetical protein